MIQSKAYKWCAIDAEGDVGDMGLIGVSFATAEISFYTTDPDIITSHIYHFASTGYTFIAHNAEYDLSVIFWQLDIPMKAVYYNRRFNRGEWRYDPRKAMVQLWDTMALSGGLSLEKLGKALNLEKYPTPQRLLGKDPDRFKWICDTHNVGECETCYAVRDAEICYKFMEGLCEQLNAWGVTPHRRISGLAEKVWRALDHPKPPTLHDKRIRELGRAAYHGGRTETYKLGRVSPVYCADVTSMYPWVMLSAPFPDPEHMVYIEDPDDIDFIHQYEGCADVTLNMPDMYVPPLPFVGPDLLCYPVGQLRGCYTLHELRYSMGLGATIRQVHKATYSPYTMQPFSTFINVNWNMRQAYKDSHDPRELFAKLFMNNLYGRMGMREDMQRTDIFPADSDISIHKQPKTTWYTRDHRLYLTYERTQYHKPVWTNVVWAAQITAYARVHLHTLMMLQGDSLLYCDTDSIFSQSPITGTSDGLGGLREDGQYQSIIIAAPKQYALQEWDGSWHARAKGVPKAYALQYLRDGKATYKLPVKPMSQDRRKTKAGTWLDVTRYNSFTPARRQPLSIDVLGTEYGYSDTAPRFVGPLSLPV